MKVHWNKGFGITACGAQKIWVSRQGGGSTQITSNKNPAAVTCKKCKRAWNFPTV